MTGRPTLVILRALGLGDLLVAVPAIRALSRALPEHRTILAAPPAMAPLLGPVGGLDELLPAAPLTPLPREAEGPDVAVNLHGRGPQSHRILLSTDPRRLVAFRHPDIPESTGLPEWRAEEHEVDRWCRMLLEQGIPADPDDLRLGPPPAEAPDAWRGATVIHPGAASGARRWPADRFAVVAGVEASRGRTVLITGSAPEADLAAGVARKAGLPPSSVLAGRTDLGRLAALVAGAGRVISGDTGLAHLASGYGTPSVVLFGPTAPWRWGPPPGPHVALWTGRTGDPHGAETHPGLLEISVDDVLGALDCLEEPEMAR